MDKGVVMPRSLPRPDGMDDPDHVQIGVGIGDHEHDRVAMQDAHANIEGFLNYLVKNGINVERVPVEPRYCGFMLGAPAEAMLWLAEHPWRPGRG